LVRVRDRVRAREMVKLWVAGMYRVAVCTTNIADLPILGGLKLQYGFPYSRHSPSN